MPLDEITYANKTNLNPVTDRPKQTTAEDFNEIKTVVNAAIAELNSGSISQNVYSVRLPSAATVAGRIALAVEGTDYPAGWILTPGASVVDININHGLSRRVHSVTVFTEVSGTIEQQLFNTAAYNGVQTLDVNNLLVQSLATIQKAIVVYILFK
jgi:hypothetical protein